MNNASQAQPTVLVLMTEQEKNEFMPPDIEAGLREMFPNLVWVDAPLEVGQWHYSLREQRPEIVVCAWETPPLPLEAAEHLKYLCFLCGSVRSLVPRELIERGLIVTNWGSIVSNTVAECSLLLILSALRRVGNWSVAMRTRGEWKQGRHPDTLSLFGRRVGLHGLGAISRELARLLVPFNVELSAYSPSVPDETYRKLNIRRADSLEDLFSTSDVLVELAPGKPDNYHLVGDDLLRLLPQQAVFVNLGRGMVVDEAALVRASRERGLHIALDVYETEPLPADSPLRRLDNITLLPHLGGPTPDRRRDCGELALQNLGYYVSDLPLMNVIDLGTYDRAT
ncbi:phosphoglycerate dehydrogenase-like enzyme [Rhodopirellula rubra]|uniref:Phosphoglycerate dehydrogenase-like enzyme n=1 Tax=Aporhodopirellula rubra TaxID=980271 RepID=A0A7W5DZD6_9BACT|nr:hydroxyacid dehydrogenase [Aporhodopirellula rubra]MBB3207311.1 phosphoglycerate dehydrogenase-like enzyme [Aporhodopirellula rubra]